MSHFIDRLQGRIFMSSRLPALSLGQSRAATKTDRAIPDPFANPAFFDAILWRRFVAHVIDSFVIVFVIIGAWMALLIANIVTFGLLSIPMAFASLFAPILYYSLFIGSGRSATPGMRVVDIEVRRIDGLRPTPAHGLLRTMLFYATIGLLTPLVLLVALFSDKRRAAHDYLSGTIVINTR